MNLEDAYSQFITISTACHSITDVLTSLKKEFESFVFNHSLTGESYDNARLHIVVSILPLLDNFISVVSEIESSTKHFVFQYQTQVDYSSLDSEQLEMQIRELQKIISKVEASNFFLSEITPLNFRSSINDKGNSSADSLRDLKKALEEKLENLLNYDKYSQAIFSNTLLKLDQLEYKLTALEEKQQK